ncbi:DUF362 domain-containing protein [Thermoflexus sp.]|uniref:DUF362 domain-containing protein n=1 Tax=Thermoflexus sp. TaxID=1969742 RepID=UPI0025D22105|nr:DUF362 domain-containing protein [Thermoflexus sp.]MDW8065760.1 DUF362 domain-containing protein [Anaerolineae bacterium]MCS6964770.1 DUF362 domain-containing protein [Thermoflexus sp.]MCS7352211.1 DUF362 domain-containing protein [Thermoflexus sp.]MCX7691121.1 DUF362 domain-containing protein [Thermoflexus sp.]MDW8181672.1 DUF362 domain-containing protein [Anaerolineae bacterium]
MAAPRLTRRAFLRLMLLAGIGGGLAIAERQTRPVGLRTFLQWTLRGWRRRVEPPAVVALGASLSYDENLLRDALAELWAQADMPDVSGRRVLVKPNLIEWIEGRPLVTAPEVVGAVVDLLRSRGAEVVIGEGPGFRRDAGPVVAQSGLGAVLARRNVPFVDLNYDDPRPVPPRDGWFPGRSRLWLPRHVVEADLIVSVAKLKTHHWAGVTLSLKNLFGVVPGICYGWPKNMLHVNGITPSILGLKQTLPPVVSVIDGIIGMEGDGPLFGTPVPHGVLLVGRDPLAVDITGARLMGFEPEEIEHLSLGMWAGIGQGIRIETRGASMEALRRRYQPPPK